MFKKTFAFFIFLFLVTISYIFFNFFLISKKDISKYKNLIIKKKNIVKKHSIKDETSSHNRMEVEKSLYLSNKGKRVFYKLTSKNAVLEFQKKKKKFKIFENLYDLKLDMISDKNELNKNSFFAKKGIFEYPANIFFANDLSFNFSNNLNGTANKIDLFFNKKTPTFKIKNCVGNFQTNKKANLNSIEFCAKEIHYSPEEETISLDQYVFVEIKNFGKIFSEKAEIFFQKDTKKILKIIFFNKTKLLFKNSLNPNSTSLDSTSLKSQNMICCNGKIVLDGEKNTIEAQNIYGEEISFIDDRVEVFSQRANFFFSDIFDNSSNFLKISKKAELKSAILEKNVKFIAKNIKNQTGYGVASKAIYNPIKKDIHLIGSETNKVLFFHAQNTLKLSAKEILINLLNEKIDGIGNVRFSFDFEEEKKLSKFFSKSKIIGKK
jgi:hypothetical protein